MTITEAQNKIDEKRRAGLISDTEARRLEKKIRRTGDYGNKWSWQQQAQMRDLLLAEF
jgi:hypothetical protein